MGFHINIHDVPRIYGYKHAIERFNSIEPIRGGDQSVRRIGKRNDASKWLKHEIRDGIDVYIAGFHHTDVVTFYPTHYEIYMGGWNTMSTQIFIQGITGRYSHAIAKSKFVPSGFDVGIGADVMFGTQPMWSTEAYKFDYAGNPLQEMPTLTRYRINRKRMNEVRAVAKPFYKYMEAMHAITPIDQVTRDSYESLNMWRGNLVQYLTDESKWWGLFEYLASNTYISHYHNRLAYERSLSGMKRMIENELKGASPEVLEPVV